MRLHRGPERCDICIAESPEERATAQTPVASYRIKDNPEFSDAEVTLSVCEQHFQQLYAGRTDYTKIRHRPARH